MQITVTNHLNHGSIKAPPSKSITHRLLLCASLSNTTVVINNPLYCDDTNATINALKQLGATFTINNSYIVVKPIDVFSPQDKLSKVIDCHDSATTFRVLVPILSKIYKQFTLKASDQLVKRIKMISLEEMGYPYIYENNHFYFQSELTKPYQATNLTTQIVSGQLLSLLIDHNQTIKIKSPLLDPYIILTMDALKTFGHNLCTQHDGEYYTITYINKTISVPSTVNVEGDFSAASNFLVMGLFGHVTVTNLNQKSHQSDRKIIDLIKQLGGSIITRGDKTTTTLSKLRGANLDISDCRDLGPLVIALACVCEGTSVINGLSRLAFKESNRLVQTVSLLKKANAQITLHDDHLIIKGSGLSLKAAKFNSFQDHRLVMMLCALASCFDAPLTITNVECINKSYPNFFDDFKKVGGLINKEEA